MRQAWTLVMCQSDAALCPSCVEGCISHAIASSVCDGSLYWAGFASGADPAATAYVAKCQYQSYHACTGGVSSGTASAPADMLPVLKCIYSSKCQHHNQMYFWQSGTYARQCFGLEKTWIWFTDKTKQLTLKECEQYMLMLPTRTSGRRMFASILQI